jgi:hypothetical protein
MNKRTVSFILALFSSGLFLFTVLYSSSGFNFIPYMIHETVSPGGPGEAKFIIIFDVLFAIFLFWILYKLFVRVLLRKDAR